MGIILKKKHQKLDFVLRKLYYNINSSVAYSSIKQLYHAAKYVLKGVKYQDVREWLQGETTFTLHKPIRRRFKRRRTIVAGIDQQWQADLADMQHLAKQNDNKKYLLCVIDVFSKFSWVVPIPNKTGKTLIVAFQSILQKSKRTPISLQTDKGTEFKNKEFQQWLKRNRIHFFTTENPETKASIVERFQRTLKTRMWKYFTHMKTKRYIDILEKLVKNYNNTYHRSIKSNPASVNQTNEAEISENLYPQNPVSNKKAKFKIGNRVRINKTKRTFDKGYLPNWTQELFEIVHVNKSTSPVTYVVKDLDGEQILGTFYEPELQFIKDDEIYEIDSVLAKRTRRKGNKIVREIKVNWKGYPTKFQSWIPESYLVNKKS